MVADVFEKQLEACAVVQVFGGVNFEAQVDALFGAGIEHRQPAPGQLGEGCFNKAVGALREGKDVRPCQCTGKSPHVAQAQAPRRDGRAGELVHRPGTAGSRVALQVGRCKTVAQGVVCRVYRHQLAKEMRGQLADHQPVFGQHGGDVVAVGLAACGELDIEQTLVPGRYLQRLEAHVRSPPGDVGQ
ncbi:hypothetical protein D3C77_558990 [compost metagenome]